MKRKIIYCTATCLLICSLAACGEHHHVYTNADCTSDTVCSECGDIVEEALGHTTEIGVCLRCDKMQNEELVGSLNTAFSEIMDVGTELISCVSGIDNLKAEEQYKRFTLADEYTASMNELYTDIIDLCYGKSELTGMVYQLKLLQNSCPDAILGSDTTSIANQIVLYQLYLQQISSSFGFLSEYMDYLAGNCELPDSIIYFDEVVGMPTPDSVIYGITLDSEMSDSGVKQYMYIIGEDETDASMNYNIYLSAVELVDGLRVNITDSYVSVEKDGTMVSAMMAGTDPIKGYFLIISFQE